MADVDVYVYIHEAVSILNARAYYITRILNRRKKKYNGQEEEEMHRTGGRRNV